MSTSAFALIHGGPARHSRIHSPAVVLMRAEGCVINIYYSLANIIAQQGDFNLTSTSPFKSYTVSLFGIKTKASLQAKAFATAAVSVAPPATRTAKTPPSDAPKIQYDRELAEYAYSQESIEKSKVEMGVWHAKERQFAEENGFERRVNSMALGSYAMAKSGNFGTPSFKSRDEAAEWLANMVGSMARNAFIIKSSERNELSLAKPEVAAAYGDVKTKQLLAMHADSRLAAEMDLFVVAATVSKTFRLSTPLYRQEGAVVTFTPMDFKFGKTTLSLRETGELTASGQIGRTGGVDRRV